jgi:hypothetical protein
VTATAHIPLDATRSGVYRSPVVPEPLWKSAARAGFAHFSVDLDNVAAKAAFLKICATRLGFPAAFGHNWDAFADSLQDFSWHAASGYLIHFQHAGAFAAGAPHDYAVAIAILRETAAFWKARGTAFIVLVDDALDVPVFAP